MDYFDMLPVAIQPPQRQVKPVDTTVRIATTKPVTLIAALLVACGLSLALPAGAEDTMSRADVVLSKRAVSLPGPAYAWATMPQVKDVQKDARLQDAQFNARLRAALDKALQAKGYRPAEDRTKADFVVAYGVGIREAQEVLVHVDQAAEPVTVVGCGWDICSEYVVTNDSTAQTKVQTTHRSEGGLMIEVIEPRTIKVLWRALNRGTVKRGDGAQAPLDAIATNTLAQLPAYAR